MYVTFHGNWFAKMALVVIDFKNSYKNLVFCSNYKIFSGVCFSKYVLFDKKFKGSLKDYSFVWPVISLFLLH